MNKENYYLEKINYYNETDNIYKINKYNYKYNKFIDNNGGTIISRRYRTPKKSTVS